jgi:hypothetical protein
VTVKIDWWQLGLEPRIEARALQAISQYERLPVMDRSVQRVLALTGDEDSATSEVVVALEADPALTANVLRYANSAFVGRPIRANLFVRSASDQTLLDETLGHLGLSPDALDGLARSTSGNTPVDIACLNDRVAELERLAGTDDLTGLANRRQWMAATRDAIRSGEAGSVLLCDLDQFKQINDKHGHATGDLVLTEIARILTRYGLRGSPRRRRVRALDPRADDGLGRGANPRGSSSKVPGHKAARNPRLNRCSAARMRARGSARARRSRSVRRQNQRTRTRLPRRCRLAGAGPALLLERRAARDR